MDIQPADPEQAPLLKQIAIAAKGYWGYPDAWLARWGSLLAFPPDYIRTNYVYIAIDNGEVVGFYALIHRGDICLLDHLWVIPEHIGTGAGGCCSAMRSSRRRHLEPGDSNGKPIRMPSVSINGWAGASFANRSATLRVHCQ